MMKSISRRGFLAALAVPLAGDSAMALAAEPVIDIHQHTNYAGRDDAELLRHQRAMGVSKTVLLPAGSKYGLAVQAGGNDSVLEMARANPGEFAFFANELPDIPEARQVIRQFLDLGALGIGEQKFPVEADSKHIDLVADLARDYDVPVLLHFEHEHYNLNFTRFHKVLERHPRVAFIGHAQTWWGNIDRNHRQSAMYPTGKVTAGGYTDRLLSDYSNMYGDMSAGSGLNALLRDEDHARGFLLRHRGKLMFGSDCNDRDGGGEKCSGGKMLAAIRRLAPDRNVERGILYANASRLLKFT